MNHNLAADENLFHIEFNAGVLIRRWRSETKEDDTSCNIKHLNVCSTNISVTRQESTPTRRVDEEPVRDVSSSLSASLCPCDLPELSTDHLTPPAGHSSSFSRWVSVLPADSSLMQ